MRILFFGDSITQGFWDTQGGWVQRFRSQLDTQALDHLDGPNSFIFNLGVMGDTSRQVLQRIAAETSARTEEGRKSIIVLQIGTNDACMAGGQIQVPLSSYKRNLEAIVAKAQTISSQLILIGLIACNEARTTPVSWGDYQYTNQRLKAYEDQLREVAIIHNLPVIPLFDAFSAALTANPTLLQDGLHPSDAGHELIYKLVEPQLTQLLTKKSPLSGNSWA